MIHDLKCWRQGYDDIDSGKKEFEVRFADREFSVGDALLLREWTPHGRGALGGEYTGREMEVEVTYIYGASADAAARPIWLHGGRQGEALTYPVVVLGISRKEPSMSGQSARDLAGATR